MRFSAVAGSEELKAAQLLELFRYVIHWSNFIEIAGKDMLVSDDKIAARLKDKLVAASFTAEPFKATNKSE